MALTLSGHCRFAPMFTKQQDSCFAQLQQPLANIMDDVSENRSGRFCYLRTCSLCSWGSIACRLAATAITLAKYAELYEKLSVCLQQS
jgi:hypothetical protein